MHTSAQLCLKLHTHTHTNALTYKRTPGCIPQLYFGCVVLFINIAVLQWRLAKFRI